MKTNEFELIARVSFVDIKYTQKGLAYTRLLLSKRKANKEDVEYQSFNVTLFGDVAEKAGNYEKGANVHITGVLSTSKYEKDGKQVERLELIGNTIELVDWNDETKKYEVVDEEIPF